MKKLNLFVLLALSLAFMGITLSCRNASKYADDVWKAVDDKVDDIGKGRKGPKRPPQQKKCNQCNGTGKVYDIYWNAYNCSNCGGDGKVWINL